MMSPKISIIVAVYKAEAYLHRCVDSLLAQTFRDFEILLIDDGSPDNSGKICDDYAKQDARIRVFHKENGGVSSARQCGMEHVRGEYVIHADPDDWVEPNMLEELYAKAKESHADMVICDLYEEYKYYTKYSCQRPVSLTVSRVLAEVSYGKLYSSLTNKLVHVKSYEINNIKFPLGITHGEDDYAVIFLLNRINSVAYIPRAYYHIDRYSNVNSLSKNYTKEVFKRYVGLLQMMKNEIYNNEPSKTYNSYVCYVAYNVFVYNVLSSAEYVHYFRNEIKEVCCSYASFKMKAFVIASATGLNKIAYKIYRTLRGVYDLFVRQGIVNKRNSHEDSFNNKRI